MSHEKRKRPSLACAALLVGLSAAFAHPAAAQTTLRAAVIALTDDAELRMAFEQQLAAKAREHRYDAVTSYDIVPKVKDLGSKSIVKTLESAGIQAVLMARPAAVGPGSSLESVRNEVDPKLYESMRAFAKDVSPSGGDDLIAVVHLAIYVLRDSQAQLISGGAVWLDQPVESREQGLAQLEDLVLSNVDLVRPAIREHLGLPPLR
ncbi:MAG TPA: hypothetical protein VFV10_01440 [Gammaproteobacteria bacterium]|nr:hypothetical protein [Gammaproteobacteria bacterium]